jgi:hypothetical protein
MKKIHLIFIIFTFACNPVTIKENKTVNRLKGNWAFLDLRGNYNEAFFNDTSYITYNLIRGVSPEFRYFIKNDSLWSNIDKRKKGLNRIAKIQWLEENKVILITEFSRDTLEKLTDEKITLENINPGKDSVLFREAIHKRYENFLVSKGIITTGEIKEFKKKKTIPDDVIKKNMQ